MNGFKKVGREETTMDVYQLRKPTNAYDVINLDIMEMSKQIVKNSNKPMSDNIIQIVMNDVPIRKNYINRAIP